MREFLTWKRQWTASISYPQENSEKPQTTSLLQEGLCDVIAYKVLLQLAGWLTGGKQNREVNGHFSDGGKCCSDLGSMLLSIF